MGQHTWFHKSKELYLKREELLAQQAIKRLNEFWDKYPDGVIYFG